MAKRQFTLTHTEQQELRQAYDACQDGAQRTRLQVVRLYGTGWSVGDICEITGCTPRSLLRWCRAYRQDGLAQLADQRSGGNHTLLSAEQRTLVQRKLQQYTPRDLFGSTQCATGDGVYWTVPDLRRAVERWTGVVYQDTQSYRDLFSHCGFSYQDTEWQYRSGKEADVAPSIEIIVNYNNPSCCSRRGKPRRM